ncbi:MAG: IS1595 family transposase, partial [Candidatus Dormibacteraceae bacterium]
MAPGNRKAPKRSTASESKYSLVEFMQDFPDDETCLVWLWTTRYAPDGTNAMCSRCGEERAFARYETKQQRQSWTCTVCSLHVHPTAGTIFHKSSTSLHLWFYAMYLMTSTRCGISAKQLERELGVTYKTDWRMFSLIRNELMGPENVTLRGQVELDEMYVGGKPRLSDKAEFSKSPAGRQSAAVRWTHEKRVPVFGMVERHGKVAAHVVPKRPQAAIMSHVDGAVARNAVVYTDDSRLYDRLGEDGWDHQVIDHSAKVYV